MNTARFLRLLVCIGSLATPLTANAAETGGCESFAWPLATELQWLAAADSETLTSGAKLPSPPAKALPSPKAAEHFASVPRHTARTGWAIQVGAYEDESEAKQKLGTAKGKVSRALEKAEAYIERTVKGAKTYYRARFAGFDRDQAEAVCKKLKREDVACMALKI